MRDPAQLILNFCITVCIAGASTIGLANAVIWPGIIWLILTVFFFTLLVVGLCTFFRPTYGDLAKREAAATAQVKEQRAALHRALEAVVRALNRHLFKGSTDCRISVYSVEGDELVLLSRVSSNAALEVRGQLSRSLWEGSLGAAWANETSLHNYDAPDRESWEAAVCDEGGFSPEQASRFTMMSQSIVTVRLDFASDKVGVISLESATVGRFNVSMVNKVRASLLMQAIAEIVAQAHAHFPSAIEHRDGGQTDTGSPHTPEPQWKQTRAISPTAIGSHAPGSHRPATA